MVKDLITNWHASSCSGDSFSTIHGNFVPEHFKKETKGTVGSLPTGYSSDI